MEGEKRMYDIHKILAQLEAVKAAEIVKNWKQAKALETAISHYRKQVEDETKVVLRINFNVVVTGEDIDDIMCSAMEGGINYWCGKVEVDGKYLGEYASEQISRGGTLILHDTEEDRTELLTKEKLLQGIRMYAEQSNRTDIFEVIDHELHIDCGMVDAEVADAIVQYAIFSEIFYG